MVKETKRITELLDEYYHNRVRMEKIREVILQLGNKKDLEEVESVMKKHWREEKRTGLLGEKEYEMLLDGIHHRINRLEEEKSGKATVRMARFLMKAAAVLFLPLFITTFFLLNNRTGKKVPTSIAYNEIYTPLAARTRFLLPDSTVVWLNAGSSLRFPLVFTGKTREVYLRGEGYFDVAKNHRKPFVIHTKRLDVTALGTSLDVMAYANDRTVRTTLIEGKVKVEKKSTGTYVFLKPSMQAVMDTVTGKLRMAEVETRYYTSWKEGKLIFRHEPMEAVAHKLERWFNCTIYIENDKLRKYKYTGTIEMETLREVLNLIQITTPMKYKYDRDTREVWLKPM